VAVPIFSFPDFIFFHLCFAPLRAVNLFFSLRGSFGVSRQGAKTPSYYSRWFFNMKHSDIPAPFVGIYPPEFILVIARPKAEAI